MKILVVDDDELMLQMLESALRRHGHEVATATNGLLALEHLHNDPCQIVISDWEMPEMNGVELVRAIRGNASSSGYVYLILLTGRDGTNHVIEGLTAGADDFVTKPFNPTELSMRVRVAERILALESRDLIIFGMAKLAESRDPDTGAHLERVRNYSCILARHLATQEKFAPVADANFVRMIYLTSPLHDIGKVAIPDCVLLKPSGLSDEEFGIMKEHTTMGAATLDAALAEYPEASFLVMAKEIALSHHERWDGSGYPNKLKGEAIPLCGRIVALADVYDALTSKRVYKGSFSHAVARSIITEGRATHFDPDIVDAFLRCESQFVDVGRRYGEPAVKAA
jgi:putative two-component system response regulator